MSPVEQNTIDCEYLAYFCQKNKKFHRRKHGKNQPQKLLMIGPIFFSELPTPVQNQPKSHILFHKKDFLRNLYIVTLDKTLKSRKFKNSNTTSWCFFGSVSARRFYCLYIFSPFLHNLWSPWYAEYASIMVFVLHPCIFFAHFIVQKCPQFNSVSHICT